MSGRPLFHRSTVVLARVHIGSPAAAYRLIGIGGIDSAESALAKIDAGASLIQLYTGLIYEGPGLIGSIKRHLVDHGVDASPGTCRNPCTHVGTQSETWAAKPLELAAAA